MRFDAAVVRDCESAPLRPVAAQEGLPAETVCQIDQRALQRWAAGRNRKPLRDKGVEEISLGKQVMFLSLVSHWDRREPPRAGKDR